MNNDDDTTDCKAMHREHRMTKLTGESVAAPAEELAVRRVDAGSTGSLPVSSAEGLARAWEMRAKELRTIACTQRQQGGGLAALRNDDCADTLYICINDLRRQMDAANERQPEENNAYEPRDR